MINISKLRGLMTERGKTQAQVAEAAGISTKTLQSRFKTGKFWTDEIDAIVKYLDIEHPEEIFLSK